MPESDPTPAPPTGALLADLVREEVSRMAEVRPDGRRGYQTSEGWSHLIVLLLGVAMAVYGMVHHSDLALGLAVGLISIDSAAYKVARGLAKSAGAALLLCCCLLLAGCVAPEAIEQARHEAALCHGHAADVALPLEARQIAADETRAWRAQHRALTGDDVPGAATWPALPAELDAVPGGAPGSEAPR